MKSRDYRMTRRAELVDQTRLRITEAAVKLHTTVGPARISIASVAEEAGVTRLTVYRHFADMDALFVACRGHWLAENPPPDPRAWAAVQDPEARARVAFTQLYGWFRDHATALFPLARDASAMPVSTQQARAAENRALADAVIGDGARSGRAGHQLQAVAGHLVDFWTWRSFEVEQGLSPTGSVDAAVRMLRSFMGPSRPGRRTGCRVDP